MDAILILSLIGGAIGTATAFFVILDRLFRYRPLAFVVVKGNRNNPHRYLRVKNIGPMDVIIMDIVARPAHFEIAIGHSVRQITNAAAGVPVCSILEPGGEIDFPVFINKQNGEDTGYTGKIRFIVRWRKASSTWIRQAPAIVFTSTEDIKRMEQMLR